MIDKKTEQRQLIDYLKHLKTDRFEILEFFEEENLRRVILSNYVNFGGTTNVSYNPVIKTVKRTSDNLVISVGDFVRVNNDIYLIDLMWYHSDKNISISARSVVVENDQLDIEKLSDSIYRNHSFQLNDISEKLNDEETIKEYCALQDLNDLCQQDEKKFLNQIDNLVDKQKRRDCLTYLDQKKLFLDLRVVNPKETSKLLNWMYSSSTDGSDGIIFAGSKIERISWNNVVNLDGYTFEEFYQGLNEIIEVENTSTIKSLYSRIFQQLFSDELSNVIDKILSIVNYKNSSLLFICFDTYLFNHGTTKRFYYQYYEPLNQFEECSEHLTKSIDLTLDLSQREKYLLDCGSIFNQNNHL